MFKNFLAYEFTETIEGLERSIDFPPIVCFQNTLTGETISSEDHRKSSEIFKSLKFENLREYMEAYCLLDVYLLAEVFMQFRVEGLTNFGIDPCNFISLPGMGLDCFLKKSEIQLDYITSGDEIF